MNTTETTEPTLEDAYQQGRGDARTAHTRAVAAGRTIPTDSDGAEVLWEHAPDIPFPRGTNLNDAYMDGWYDVAYELITGSAA